MRDRSIVGELFFVEFVLISWEEEWQNKIWIDQERYQLETRGRFMMLVNVGRSADRHCLRRDVGMGPRSEKELDEWEMILDTSSSETKEKEPSMVGEFLGGTWGAVTVEEVFKAELMQFENFVWE